MIDIDGIMGIINKIIEGIKEALPKLKALVDSIGKLINSVKDDKEGKFK